MKKSISIGLMSLFVFGFSSLNAQNYRNALGLAIDFGDGPTLVGPQYKHSFDGSNALNAQVLFGNHTTAIGFDYSYNQKFAGSGLWWYVGLVHSWHFQIMVIFMTTIIMTVMTPMWPFALQSVWNTKFHPFLLDSILTGNPGGI